MAAKALAVVERIVIAHAAAAAAAAVAAAAAAAPLRNRCPPKPPIQSTS